MIRDAYPGSAVSSTGRIMNVFVAGNADNLRGILRWREVYLRLRQRYDRRAAWRMTRVFRRQGVALSGDRTNAVNRAKTRRYLQQIELHREDR